MNSEQITQEEHLSLTLNTKTSRIPTSDLIEYLSKTNTLVNSINCTLNEEYSIGYDSIDVDVIALKKGSFNIDYIIREITNNPTLSGIISSVIGALITKLFTKDSNPQIVFKDNKQINIYGDTLLKNKKTRSSVGAIAQTAVEDPTIKGIVITHQKDDGKMEKVAISKKDLSKVMYKDEPDEPESHMLYKIKLDIISPVFEDIPSNWKVAYKGKKYSAKMCDTDFIETMSTKGIAFAKGDAIIADLETIIKDNGMKVSHLIKKVHNYPRYTKIKREERNLFDN